PGGGQHRIVHRAPAPRLHRACSNLAVLPAAAACVPRRRRRRDEPANCCHHLCLVTNGWNELRRGKIRLPCSFRPGRTQLRPRALLVRTKWTPALRSVPGSIPQLELAAPRETAWG